MEDKRDPGRTGFDEAPAKVGTALEFGSEPGPLWVDARILTALAPD